MTDVDPQERAQNGASIHSLFSKLLRQVQTLDQRALPEENHHLTNEQKNVSKEELQQLGQLLILPLKRRDTAE